MNISSNYVNDIIDEIALEGLDGITPEALWKRLSVRQNFCFKIDEKSKSFIWRLCTQLNVLNFYELPEKRPPLKYYDLASLHKEKQEANIELDQLYPYCSVKSDNGIFGSCKNYTTRKDVTDQVVQMDLQAAEEAFSDRLVIVASQECRNLALLGNKCPPNLDFSKSQIQYDILERIGRSRNLGIPTHGKGSLQSIVDDSRSIFHYLKILIKYKIIKKQSLFGSLQTNPNGSKIYLMRFYGEYLNEYQAILQTAIEELKCRENNRMSYGEFYQLFDPDKRARVKKYCKTTTFRKYIMVSKLMPYREFFPNAPQSEWERKCQAGEKMIRCFQLLDPNIEVTDIFERECESDDDENAASDFLITKTYFKGIPLLQQTYYHVKNSGSHGITIRELSEVMGLSRSFVRSALKRLIQGKHCKSFEEISGRRHTLRYMVGENEKNIAAASEIFQILSESNVTKVKEKAAHPEKRENFFGTGVKQNVKNVSMTREIEKKIESFEEESVPYRTLRRIGIIIKTIKTHHYRLFFQIYKHVLEEEVKEGLKVTVCRMTVNRILNKLEKDGLIKVVDLFPKEDKSGTAIKVYMEPTFILDEAVTETLLHTHLTYKPVDLSTQENDENIRLERQICGVLLENLTTMKKMLQNMKVKSDRTASKEKKERELCCSPKFIRLNIIHDLMFYLVYDYSGIPDKTQEELLQELSKTCEIDEELKKEMPKIYGTQLSSYLFVPPLKAREDSVPGWFLISDLLIRLPLSIFVKILRINDTNPELLNYLNHPVRKHFLIKDLPRNVRWTIFNRLQFIAAFVNDIKRLSFLGLVQFGVKCGKELYQTLLYLNKKASLLDTTSSPPGYLHVPSDIKFPVKQYEFKTRADIKNYWQDMCHICLATNLGVRANMIGKEIVAVRELSKDSLKKIAEPKSASKVMLDDDGTLPGDHLGAGGIDSVMFSFLRSNWIGPVTRTKETVKPVSHKKVPLEILKREIVKKTQRIYLQKARLKRLQKKTENQFVKSSWHDNYSAVRKTRTVKERQLRCKRTRTSYYDEVDMQALRLRNNLRVTWCPAEDHLLLIAKVAMLYLCPIPRGLMRIPWSEVRRCLRDRLAESRDKTQKAIARRIKYMMKNQTTKRSVDLCLGELNQSPEVAERFSLSEDRKAIKPSAPNLIELQNALYQKFHALVDYIKERFSKGPCFKEDETEEDLLPDILDAFKNQFECGTENVKESLSLKNIRESVIRAILVSSLCCRSDKTSSAIQLFDIYRQYEDEELHRAIKKLNRDKVITVRKNKTAGYKKDRKYLPLSHSPCKLSYSFQSLLNMKYSHNLYSDSFEVISKLLHSRDGNVIIDLNDCNVPFYALACLETIAISTTIPEQIIVLDCRNSTDEDAFAKLIKRYGQILKLSNANSKLINSSDQPTLDDSEVETRKRPNSDDLNTESSAKKSKLDLDKAAEEVQSVEVLKEEVCEGGKNTEKVGEKIASGSGSWRAVLYMMREEAKNEINNFTGARAQDFFAVSASEVHCSKTEQLEPYARKMDSRSVNDHIRNIVGRFSVPLSLVSEETLYNEFLKRYNDSELLAKLKSVLDFIHRRKEFGVSNGDLRQNFEVEKLPLIIRYLVDSKIVIKTGIDETRYVGQKYSTPWLLNSFRLTRLEREKIEPSELSAVDLTESVSDSSNAPKRRKKGIITSEDLKSGDYVPPPCAAEESNKVKMLIRPWIRVDGSLNRKVLDRFLGTVLGFIMINPGLTVKSVMDKFSPSFVPIWTKDLIEILHRIGCVSFVTYKVKKATLFSKEEVITFDGYTGIDDDNCIVVDAKVDAITTLGLFIGKRMYSKDFLVNDDI